MRVLLINPWQAEVLPPPSLGYLQAVIKQMDGVEVVAKDMDEAMIDNSFYDLVGVTFHSFSVRYAKQIREKFKGMRLVCGGHHPSAMPEQMLSVGYDQVCIGEGEDVIKAMINGNTESIIKASPVDVNSLPIPDYTGLKGDWNMGIPVISSRGCAFSCSFCASSEFWKRKWKMRTAESVIEEIHYIVKDKKLTNWMFEDDNFTLNKQRAYEICKGISLIGNFRWQCTSRAETLVDRDFVKMLYNSGCRVVWIGVESLSQNSLDRCRKNTTVEKMLEGIRVAEEEGLETASLFISGIPGDTINDIKETVQNIHKGRIRRRGSTIMWVLPNTEIYTLAQKCEFDDNIYLSSGAPFYTCEQPLSTLEIWSHMLNNT